MKTWQKGVCIGAAVGVAAPFAIVGKEFCNGGVACSLLKLDGS